MAGNIRKHTPHNFNVICDVCGRKRKKSQTVMAYGSGDIPVVLSCLDGCADYRHPLNEPPPVIFDGRPVPDARPDTQGPKISYTSDVDIFVTWGNFYGNPKWGSFPLNYSVWGKFT